ncbi:hypothetical protein LTS08_008763 [Lithohypha guttulata]|nr:hypothetical protein LTS08_008763 [Lithohypha guttulata]
MAQQRDALLRSLLWLQTSHEYSDLRIFCQDEVFHLHKAVVCSRSKYFAIACKWGKDGNPKDEVELKDDDSKLVGLMVDYLYQLNYDDLLPSKPPAELNQETSAQPESAVAHHIQCHENLGHEAPIDEPVLEPEIIAASEVHMYEEDEWSFGIGKKSKKDKKKKKGRLSKLRLRDHDQDVSTARLVVNTLMYALADKYEIDDLKALAKQKFEEAVVQDWDSQAFAYAAELVFSTTPNSDRGLRTVVTKTINTHRELVNYEEVQRLLDSGNGMAWALIQVLLGDHIDD